MTVDIFGPVVMSDGAPPWLVIMAFVIASIAVFGGFAILSGWFESLGLETSLVMAFR
jgi:hypothetical protein